MINILALSSKVQPYVIYCIQGPTHENVHATLFQYLNTIFRFHIMTPIYYKWLTTNSGAVIQYEMAK